MGPLCALPHPAGCVQPQGRRPVHLSGRWCAWLPVCVPLGEGVSVVTMAVPGNAVWCSKTLGKGLQSSQNVSGKVIEFYGLDLAP